MTLFVKISDEFLLVMTCCPLAGGTVELVAAPLALPFAVPAAPPPVVAAPPAELGGWTKMILASKTKVLLTLRK